MPSNTGISIAQRQLFIGFATLMGLSLVGALLSEQWLFLAVPPALMVGYISVIDFSKIYYLILAFIPLSYELDLPGGFATDLPTEGLIVGLMLVYLLFAIGNLKSFDGRFIKHPLILLLLMHLGWMLITVINSKLFFLSLKFFAAKLWYVVVFVFVTAYIFKSERVFRTMFWLITPPFTVALLWALFQQYQDGFAFTEVNYAMWPFFRNHVTYGAMTAMYFPFLVLAATWYPKWKHKLILIGIMLVFLAAIYFSYTRAAYISLVASLLFYGVVRLRLTRVALLLAVAGLIGVVGYLLTNNQYLEFAPDYNKAISHEQFDDLVTATYQLEDISSMERVYRWVAAGFMSKEEPVFGYGPGNFYNYYKGYTVSSFTTYVSRNEDQSGIHNYYLMTMVDQGYFGLFIYLILVLAILWYGDQIYHKTANPERRALVMAILSVLFIFNLLQLINDLMETDKFGSFFFICLAMLVRIDLMNQSEQQELRDQAQGLGNPEGISTEKE
ncbi:MAG: O-antigen ligase family protein [Bacteroidota bacterium]